MNSDHRQWAVEEILFDGMSRNQRQKIERRISEYSGYFLLFLSVGMIVGAVIFLV